MTLDLDGGDFAEYSTGLSNSNLPELIEMDRNYLSRLELRKQIIQDHHEIVIQASPTVKSAIDELYTWLAGTYLPARFPTMFTLSPSGLLNNATSETLPLQPPSDPAQTFQILGENLDDEFLILLPSEDGDGYCLKRFVTCFLSGFNTKEKFGLKLRDIHTPVPGHKEKLERSMDRFFDRLEVGKVVNRSNVRLALPIFPRNGATRCADTSAVVNYNTRPTILS